MIGRKLRAKKVNLTATRGMAKNIELMARKMKKLGLWEAFKLWREERKRARSGGDGM